MEDRVGSSEVLLVVGPGDDRRPLLPLLVLLLVVQPGDAGVLVRLQAHGGRLHGAALVEDAVLGDVGLPGEGGAAAKYILLVCLLFHLLGSLALSWRPLEIFDKYLSENYLHKTSQKYSYICTAILRKSKKLLHLLYFP